MLGGLNCLRLARRSFFGRWAGLLVGCWLLTAGTAGAQWDRVEEGWRWASFTTADGLPSDVVLELVETTRGRVWARTATGVAWYDDFMWHPMAPDPAHPGARIMALVPGLNDEVWVVADSLLYRGTEVGFEPVPVAVDGQGGGIVAVAPFDVETLLVFVRGRLYLYRGGETVAFSMPPAPIVPAWGFPGIKRTRPGGLWVNTSAGVWRWEEGAWQPWLANGSAVWVEETTAGGVLAFESNPATEGLWTWRAGGRPVRQRAEGGALVRALAHAPEGELVVVYTDGSVAVGGPGGLRRLPRIPDRLANATALLFHQNGDLWIGGSEGAALFRRAVRRWTWWGQEDPVLAATKVNIILRTRDGDVWAGTDRGVYARGADGRTRFFEAIEGHPLDAVTGLAEDPEGHVWIASGGGFSGVYQWDGRRWRPFGARDGLATPHVHRITADRQGRLWFLGLGHDPFDPAHDPPGVFVYEGGQFRPWEPSRSLPSRRIYAFAEGRDGARWFATARGLSRWKDGRWRHWTPADGLRDAKVFTVAVGADGRAWFGHQQHGLGVLDPDGRVRYLTTADGLVDDRVWEVKVHPDGDVWVTTEAGLSRYRDGVLAAFGGASGLRHTRLWPLWVERGQVLVGSLGGGLYTLSLDEDRAPPPHLEVYAPVVDERRVRVAWRVYPYRGELPPEQVRTRYRLDDGPWDAWSRRREVVLANLPMGTHALQVEAQSLFGARRTVSVTFEVVPPVYQRPLFLALVFAGVMGLGAVGLWVWQRHHQQLRRREESFRMLLENSSDLIMVVDSGGRLRYLSPSVARLLGHAPASLAGASLDPWVHPHDRASLGRTLVWVAAHLGEHRVETLRLQHHDGSWRIFEAICKAMTDTEGVAVVVINAWDVTEREAAKARIRAFNAELEQRVKARTADLERANRELASFSYSVSHDLRTPLRAIRSFAEIIASRYGERLDPEGRRYVEYIIAAGGQMERLIHDLLQYAHLGQKTIEMHPVNLAEVFERVRAVLAPRLEAHGATLDLPDAPPVIWSNATLLEQIFINLVDNALKYRSEGVAPHVRIRCERGPGAVQLAVADNGIGIPEAFQEKIFRLFQRLHSPDEVPGTGIGLAIVKKAAERLDGTVWVSSVVGQGSTFYLRLPQPVAPDEGLNKAPAHSYFNT